MHIVSLYVRDPLDPNNQWVEAGYSADGISPPSGFPALHDPWFFITSEINGVYTPWNYYDILFPVGQRTLVTIRNVTDGTSGWQIYLNDVLKKTIDYTNLVSGLSTAGEERSDSRDTPNASNTNMQLMAWSGGSPAWQFWTHGTWDHYDGTWRWWFNHVADSNHWIYTLDHQN